MALLSSYKLAIKAEPPLYKVSTIDRDYAYKLQTVISN